MIDIFNVVKIVGQIEISILNQINSEKFIERKLLIKIEEPLITGRVTHGGAAKPSARKQRWWQRMMAATLLP